VAKIKNQLIQGKLARVYRESRERKFLKKLDESGIISEFSKENLFNPTLELVEHQPFNYVSIRGYKVMVNDQIAFFPVQLPKEIVASPNEIYTIREFFLSLGYLLPPQSAIGGIKRMADAMQNAKAEAQHKVLETLLPILNSSKNIATMYTERYRVIPHVSDFHEQILEAIKAFYFGLTHISVISLIPVVEGVIRSLAKKFGHDHTRVDRELFAKTLAISRRNVIMNGTYFGFTWIPREFEEPNFVDKFDGRVQIIWGLERYIQNHLYKPSANFIGQGNLNRHGILHGFFGDYNHPYNFYKLITVLDTLCVIVSYTEGTPVLSPEPTEASNNLTHYLNWLKYTSEKIEKPT
jgi:hypothetical protein